MSDSASLFFELVSAYGKSQVLRAAAQLGIADHLVAGARTSAELAELTGCDPGAIQRLLWALAAIEVISESDGDRFALTPVGRDCLVSDSPTSLEAIAEYFSHPVCWNTWLELAFSVTTGTPAFPRVFGAPAWEYRAQHPELASLFNAAMRSFACRQQESVAAHYDFSSAEVVVDVGGGNGTLLASILAANPRARGILFDLPNVVGGAAEVLAAAGVSGRCQVIPGSFFDQVPDGGDIYVLRAIIHNWDSAAATAILASCRRAMASEARLLVIEVLRRHAQTTGRFWHHFLDLHMLVTLGGGERTADQLSALFSAAGFELTRVIGTPGDDLIEGRPI